MADDTANAPAPQAENPTPVAAPRVQREIRGNLPYLPASGTLKRGTGSSN